MRWGRIRTRRGDLGPVLPFHGALKQRGKRKCERGRGAKGGGGGGGGAVGGGGGEGGDREERSITGMERKWRTVRIIYDELLGEVKIALKSLLPGMGEDPH